MHAAVSTVLQRSDLLSRCDHVQAQARTRESNEEETTGWVPLPRCSSFTHTWFSPGSFIRDFIQQLYAVGLIDQAFAVNADPTLANDSGTRLQTEAFEHNCTLEVKQSSFMQSISRHQFCRVTLSQDSRWNLVRKTRGHYWIASAWNQGVIIFSLKWSVG